MCGGRAARVISHEPQARRLKNKWTGNGKPEAYRYVLRQSRKKISVTAEIKVTFRSIPPLRR